LACWLTSALIGLAAADRDQEAFGDVLYVGHVKRDELGAIRA
jgi:hypothetical protein